MNGRENDRNSLCKVGGEWRVIGQVGIGGLWEWQRDRELSRMKIDGTRYRTMDLMRPAADFGKDA